MWPSLGEWTLTLPIPIFGPVVFLPFFPPPKKLQSPIMRSYVKCCKIQVPPSCLSKLLWILLHIVMQSWGFAGLCILKGRISRGLLSEECGICGQTHPLHAWQKCEITVVVSLSCIKCVLMCFKSLAFGEKPQIPSSPLSNKLLAFKVAHFDLEYGGVYRQKCVRLANTGLAFAKKQQQKNQTSKRLCCYHKAMEVQMCNLHPIYAISFQMPFPCGI